MQAEIAEIQTAHQIESKAGFMLAKYKVLKENEPNLRARDAAHRLGISEAELLAIQVGQEGDKQAGEQIVQLANEPIAILKAVESLGSVMALTRNQACVHERHGVYENGEFFENGKMKMGLLVNPDIDLRLFLNHWHFAFAVTQGHGKKQRHSLQFFDLSGQAVHKIYLTNQSNADAYDALVARFRQIEQRNDIDTKPYRPKEAALADHQIDWQGFRQAWASLKDTHDFFPMLKKFNVQRLQGFRQVGEEFAYEVHRDAPEQMMQLARDKQCDIMVFVGNRGCIQIHTGQVKKLITYGDWFNVLDPSFNLHLRTSEIDSVWVTKKPTVDGHVTALEVFDAEGDIIVTFFGKRRPGQPELPLWREIIDLLPARQPTSNTNSNER